MYLMLKITCACGRSYEVDNLYPDRPNCKCPNCGNHPDSDSTLAIKALLQESAKLIYAKGENTSNISSVRFVTDPD